MFPLALDTAYLVLVARLVIACIAIGTLKNASLEWEQECVGMTAFTDVSSSLAELTLSYVGEALTDHASKERSNGASLSLTEVIKRVHLIVSHQTTLQVDVKLLCQPTIGHIPC